MGSFGSRFLRFALILTYKHSILYYCAVASSFVTAREVIPGGVPSCLAPVPLFQGEALRESWWVSLFYSVFLQKNPGKKRKKIGKKLNSRHGASPAEVLLCSLALPAPVIPVLEGGESFHLGWESIPGLHLSAPDFYGFHPKFHTCKSEPKSIKENKRCAMIWVFHEFSMSFP